MKKILCILGLLVLSCSTVPSNEEQELQSLIALNEACQGLQLLVCVKSATCDFNKQMMAVKDCVETAGIMSLCMKNPQAEVDTCFMQFLDTQCGESAPQSCLDLN